MSRVIKRYFSILLACLLVFSNFDGIKIVKAASEEINQSISIQVDKSEAQPNEDVTVSLSSSLGNENINKMIVHYELPNGKNIDSLASFNSVSKKFETKLPITEYSAAGLWKASGVDLYYKNGNFDEILGSEADFSNGDFTVLNPNSIGDTTEPTINKISVDTADAGPGDMVKVSVDATDDHSGIAYLGLFYTKSNGQGINVLATFNQQTNKYEADIAISKSDIDGPWTLREVKIQDYSGNFTINSDSDLLSSGNFSVHNEDKVAPILNGVTVDKQEAKSGETVTWSLDVTDEPSGVKSVEAAIVNVESGYSSYQTAAYNGETNRYDVTMDVDNNTQPGTWSIQFVDLTDNEGNTTEIADSTSYTWGTFDFRKASVDVVSETGSVNDTMPPVVKGVSVDKKEAAPEETVTVSVDAQDDLSGVKSVYVYARNGYDDYYSGDAIYNEESGKYELKIPITYAMKSGNWSVYSITLADNMDHYSYNNSWDGNDFSAANFTVVPSDILWPTISGVSVDKKEAKPGDTVTISLDVKDDKSGVNSIYVGLMGDYDSGGGFATYNEETQMYELKIPVTEETYPGLWRIENLSIYDNAGNGGAYHSVDYDFSAANFTVVNDIKDVAPPTVSSVSVDKTEARPGDTVTISVDATDDKSGIDKIYVYAEGNYNSYSDWAAYNPNTKKYELKIPITEDTNPGSWSIYSIVVYDEAGNGGYYRNGNDEYDFSAANFTVVNDLIDLTPPTILSVSVDKTEANPDDTVTISITADDDKSGIDQIYVGVDSNYDYFDGDAIYNVETNKYELKIPITEKTKPGLRSIDYIYVIDKAGNDMSYYNGYEDADFSAANFTVINENADITPPTVQNITVDKKEVQPGDTVKVSLDITDDKSEVSYVRIGYSGSHGGFMNAEAVYNSETQKYEAEFTIDDKTRPGTWQVSWINVMDTSSNSDYYYPEETEFTNDEFTVINDNIDIKPPVVNSVNVDKREAKVGDTVTVSINASDIQSGINNMSVTYKIGNRYYDQEAVYNWMTGMYEIKFTITDSSRPGIWSIDSIYVEDNEYNGENIYNGDNGVDFGAADFTVINENADSTPPIIQGVTVDKTEAKPNDTVKISINATDDKSGVESIYVDLENSYYGYFNGEAIFNSETNQYELSVPITDRTKPGLWSINGISVSDNEGNSKYYENGYEGNDFTAANFNVTNENADITPPTISNVSVDKTEVKPGDSVTFSLNAVDDKSGVESVKIYFNNSYGDYFSEIANLNENTNKYEVKIPITEKTKPGAWSIYYIRVYDMEYNYGYYYSDSFDFSKANFTVINENADITPPTIQGVTVDKTEAKPNDTVKISIRATDDKSGVESIYVDLENSYYGNFNGEAIFNPETNQYELSVPITDRTKPGLWSINGISVNDNEGNSKYYENGYGGNDFSAANFNVTNENVDITPPTISDVRVDQTEVEPGDTVTLSINATDDKSGLNEIRVTRKNSYGGYYSDYATYNDETDRYEVLIPITDITKSGDWSIESIRISDMEGNSAYYYSDTTDFSQATYTVINENADITPPTIQGVTVDKTEAKPNDTVKISIRATDDKSGVKSIYVDLENSYYGYFNGEAIYNPQTNQYELSVPITDRTKPGLWSIEGISVNDNEDNSKYYENGYGGSDFSGANFNVTNENADITPPTISDVRVDQTEVEPGDTVTLSINATDDKSGVRDVRITRKNSYGGYYYDYATYNESTKKFELKIPITDKTKSGVWSIDTIRLSDLDGNYGYLYSNEYNFSKANYTVINENADITPPELKSVMVDQKEVQPGEKITVSVDAVDPSGMNQVNVNFKNEYDAYNDCNLNYNEETGKFEGQISITDTTYPGNWKIDSIYLSDSEGNDITIFSDEFDFSNADFHVSNDAIDLEAPTVEGVTVDKKVVNPGEEVTISVDAKDDKSGINEISLNVISPSRLEKTVKANLNAGTGKYEAKLTLSNFAASGKWKVSSINLIDNEGNDKTVYNKDLSNYFYYSMELLDLSGADFTVTNPNEDITAPSVNSIKVNQDQFVPGEKAIVELDVQDSQSGVASVIVGYSGSNRGYYEGEAIYNEESQKYEFQIPIDNNTRPGTWTVDYITVTDNEGNEDYLFDGQYNLSSGTFTVINGNADIDAPLFKGISVDKKEAAVGDNITVSLDVTDEKSGISEVSVEYKNLYGSYLWNEAEWNPETNKYEFIIPVTAETKAGTWTVSHISVRDNEGNYQGIDNGENIDLSSGEFTVMNDQVDSTPPQFHGISVSQKVGKPGDDIVISVDATDDDSGVYRVYINLIGYNGGHIDTRAYFNKITQKYEATIPISDTTLPGTWFVGGVEIYDNKNNELYLERRDNEELGNADFTVENNEIDYQPPVIHSFSVDKKKVTRGQEVILSAEVTDDQSGVGRVYASYENSDGATFQKELFYNEETQKYEAKIFISPLFRLGNWSLNYIQARDLSDNGIGMGKDEFNDLIDGNFTVMEKDVTPPSAPTVNNVTDQSTEVSGTAETGATVTVQIDSEEYTDTADENGNFSIAIPVQTAGTEINVFVADEAGNRSEGITVVVEDVTAPEAPQVDDVNNQSTEVTGTTEALATVTVQIGSEEYTDAADEDGNFTIAITVQEAGTEVTVYATDAAGNVSERTTVTVEDVTAPEAPQVDDVTDQSTKVTGTTEPGAEVSVKIGTKTYTDTADDEGNFDVLIPKQKAKTSITVYATDAAGNDSEETIVEVEDVTPPPLTVSDVTDKSTTVTGVTEVGASVTVTIGTKKYTAYVYSNGNFKATISVQKAGTKIYVTAKDASDNATNKTVIVLDKTAPSTPIVNSVSDSSTTITGTTEAGATVTVTIGTKKYTATADPKGTYKVTIPAQKAGTALTVTATDGSGNTSLARTVTVLDKTAPSAPRVNSVSDKSKEVTGTTEAGATVTVTIGTKSYTAKADTKGNFKVTITAQKAGTKISIAARDAAGNTSIATTITVLDKTAPSTPTVNSISDQSKEVTGKAEASSTITVTIGTKKYTAKTDAKGSFKVSIPQQKAGTKLSVTATDAAGNVSTAKSITVIDKTAPAAPKVNTVKSSKSMTVTGTAEAYASITIKVGSSVIGTGKADKYGKFNVKIKAQKKNTVLTITATDAAKNVSKAATIKVQ
jgi:hypothetical protein